MGIFVRTPGDESPDQVDAKVIPFSAPRGGLTASAQRVNLKDRDDIEKLQLRLRTEWQQRAWAYYRVIGELQFGFGLLANVVSRARLFPAFVDDPHQPPIELRHVGKDAEAEDGGEEAPLPDDFIQACSDLLERITPTKGGVPSMLREMALNFSVAGECYLVQTPAKIGSGEPESWAIKSVNEIVVDSTGQTKLKTTRLAREKDLEKLPKDAFVGRMWRPSPEFSQEAESSMLGVLEPCADLLLFGRANRATARSRLNAGAMYIPDGLSAQGQPDEPDLGEDETLPPDDEHDEFEEELILAMTTPIADEESASAVVPLIIRGPAELGDKIKLLKFERAFDQVLAERMDRSLERILQGIDIPKDVVTGLANVKYSNAIVINLNLYKAHVEPLLLMIVDALTYVWIRPALRKMGFDENLVKKATVWFDATDIVIQSDREAMADAGYEKFLVSGEAWRRSHGFSEADKPSAEEVALRMIVQRGQITPELTEQILQQLSPELFNAARAAQQATTESPVPPEISQALGVPPGQAPVPPPEPPGASAPAPPPEPTAPPAPPPPGQEGTAA
jgi:hypothetical protein